MLSKKTKSNGNLSLEDRNWLIVGLGNPGDEYLRTRHNLGFMLIDLLASDFQTQVKRDECRSLIGQTNFENQTIELVKTADFYEFKR